MQCSVCKRPLLEGASSCDACGAPIQGAPPTQRIDSGAPAFVPGAVDAYAISPQPAESPQLGTPLPSTREVTTPPLSPMAISPSGPLPVARSPYAHSAPTIPVAPAYGGAPPRFLPPQGPTLVSPQPIVPPPYAYPPPVAPNAPPQNYVAVASLVCGLLGLVPYHVGLLLCALAIGFGIAGISRAAVLPGNVGRGLAIAGLVLGLVFILPAGCGL